VPKICAGENYASKYGKLFGVTNCNNVGKACYNKTNGSELLSANIQSMRTDKGIVAVHQQNMCTVFILSFECFAFHTKKFFCTIKCNSG
jgi:hypothetical protein